MLRIKTSLLLLLPLGQKHRLRYGVSNGEDVIYGGTIGDLNWEMVFSKMLFKS